MLKMLKTPPFPMLVPSYMSFTQTMLDSQSPNSLNKSQVA